VVGMAPVREIEKMKGVGTAGIAEKIHGLD
jgi:hypothetical protein